MKFKSLAQCAGFLERQGELVRICEPVDPCLEMAEITRQVFDAGGPALLFENVKDSDFPALSNLFGTYERTLKIFEPELAQVTALVDLASDPGGLLKSPGKLAKALPAAIHALPARQKNPPVLAHTTRIGRLPQIQCWPEDGGAFLLLPQVFSSDPSNPSIFKSNLGMYRIQISGNAYERNREIGLHYQLHRGIGIHHQKAIAANRPLPVTIFLGGPPAHTLAAVMPLPEGLPEIAFAGALSGRRFRYAQENGFFLSGEADFCITGWVVPGQTRPEGPFGDHLGYYSLAHDYPFIQVASVRHRPGAIFPFTVVGRPPQEDTHFGRLIHEMTRSAVKKTIPGVTAVNAVDDAGVHPLLLAKAREGYLPYEERKPRELLTHASAILGTGQLSLAKYLLIAAHEDKPDLDVADELAFFVHLLERIDFWNDLHFITRTTMDTLDYSGQAVNRGSKLVMAAAGARKRRLALDLPEGFSLPHGFSQARFAGPGMLVVKGPGFTDYTGGQKQMDALTGHLGNLDGLEGLALVVAADDAGFTAKTFANFLWVTFLRSNPSHDVYGVGEKISFKHWGCKGPLVIDARIKPFHAAPLEPDPEVARQVKQLARKGGSLHGIL